MKEEKLNMLGQSLPMFTKRDVDKEDVFFLFFSFFKSEIEEVKKGTHSFI